MDVLRYAAFATDPGGGNPAGVVLDATGATAEEMLAAAAEVGYSETAFLVPRGGGQFDVRYFSPLAEVAFCGHATIASAVAIAGASDLGAMTFHTQGGPVEVSSSHLAGGVRVATLVSLPPRVSDLGDDDLTEILECLDWSPDELNPDLPPKVAFAGAYHPIIAAATRDRLRDLRYDMPRLAVLMHRRDWTTVDLVWAQSRDVYHVRNPFPPGGVYEDPATGAAAAAFGGYLRALGLVEPPSVVLLHQGEDMGRPGTLTVGIPAEPDSGISVTGSAVPIST